MADLKQELLKVKVDRAAQERVRILSIDIETTPNLASVWGLWQQNVSLAQLHETTEVMCFAAKWYGQREVAFHSVHHDGKEQMVQRAHALMSEADILVHYNGKNFDVKHLHREFLLAGLTPPKPHKDIDLLQVVKSQFRFASNKLDHVAQELGIGAKTSHTGFQLWLDCMNGDAKAWAKMRTYNMQDVRLTEKLYDHLRPWIKGHPHLGLLSDNPVGCPNCGKPVNVQGFGAVGHTNVQAYPADQCPHCGHWLRSNERLAGAVKTRSLR